MKLLSKYTQENEVTAMGLKPTITQFVNEHCRFTLKCVRDMIRTYSTDRKMNLQTNEIVEWFTAERGRSKGFKKCV